MRRDDDFIEKLRKQILFYYYNLAEGLLFPCVNKPIPYNSIYLNN